MRQTRRVGGRIYEISGRHDLIRHVVLVVMATNKMTGKPLDGSVQVTVEPGEFSVSSGSANEFYISCPREAFDLTKQENPTSPPPKKRLWITLRASGMKDLFQVVEVEPHDQTKAARVDFQMDPQPV